MHYIWKILTIPHDVSQHLPKSKMSKKKNVTQRVKRPFMLELMLLSSFIWKAKKYPVNLETNYILFDQVLFQNIWLPSDRLLTPTIMTHLVLRINLIFRWWSHFSFLTAFSYGVVYATIDGEMFGVYVLLIVLFRVCKLCLNFKCEGNLYPDSCDSKISKEFFCGHLCSIIFNPPWLFRWCCAVC